MEVSWWWMVVSWWLVVPPVSPSEPGELSSASLAMLSPGSQLLRLLHCCSTRVVTQNPAMTDKPRMPTTPRHLLLQEGPTCDAKEGYQGGIPSGRWICWSTDGWWNPGFPMVICHVLFYRRGRSDPEMTPKMLASWPKYHNVDHQQKSANWLGPWSVKSNYELDDAHALITANNDSAKIFTILEEVRTLFKTYDQQQFWHWNDWSKASRADLKMLVDQHDQ